MKVVERLLMEPPFRYVARRLLRPFATAPAVRARWNLSPRPAYLTGMMEAVRQAGEEGVEAISVIEFGVAEGEGLLAMEREAEALESESGIHITVFGFDSAGGLPEFVGDHRDHPDYWQPGDFPMDLAALQARLSDRSTLVLGDVRETVPSFFKAYNPPKVGFVAFDLDLYSSTAAALPILRAGRILRHCPLYFDDVANRKSHRFAGELLAIAEHNQRSEVKIDRWRGLEFGRAFPELFLKQMYIAHDLSAISAVELDRNIRRLRLR